MEATVQGGESGKLLPDSYSEGTLRPGAAPRIIVVVICMPGEQLYCNITHIPYNSPI